MVTLEQGEAAAGASYEPRHAAPGTATRTPGYQPQHRKARR
jgi:hypothetical protein